MNTRKKKDKIKIIYQNDNERYEKDNKKNSYGWKYYNRLFKSEYVE